MTSVLFLIETIEANEFGRNYLKNKKLFLDIFFDFRNLYQILNIFKKKMTLIADFLSKIRTPENVVRHMCKGPFDSQHGQLLQTLLRSERRHPYDIY